MTFADRAVLVTGASKGGSATVGAQGKRHYTRLEDAWDAARTPLTDNGLAVMQWPTTPDDGGRVTVVTRVLHESGQWMQASLSMAVDRSGHMNATQQYGSAITYAARYAFLAALGLPPSDDDAQSAGEHRSDEPRKRSPKAKTSKPAPAPATVSAPSSAFGTVQTWRGKIRGAADEAALKRIWTAFNAVREHFSAQEIADLASTKDRRKAALADTDSPCTHDETERDPDGNTVCLGCDALIRAARVGQQVCGDDDLPEGFGP